MLTRPRLGTVIIYGLLVIATWVAYKFLDGKPVWQLALVGVGLVWLVAAGFALVDWGLYIGGVRLLAYRQAMAITPYLELVKSLSMLRPDQAKIVPIEMYRATVEILGGEDGPEYMLRTPWGPVPRWFVEEFLDQSSDQFLYPIRRFADGTSERDWATWLTDWFVHVAQIALPHEGSHSAAWRDGSMRVRAYGLVGLSLLEED